jgi:uncharacterized protein
MAALAQPLRWFGRKADPAPAPAVALSRGALELLVLQPSPFCNLDCSYCYLPDRANRSRMSMATLTATLHKIAHSPLLGERLSIVWHAGEPMAVPIDWYENAFERVRESLPAVKPVHHFQTNAVRIDRDWCDFIRQHQIRVGVSVDGPAFLHDRFRRTRDGRGTHAKVMHGIEQLQRAGIEFHVIAVLTRPALDHPDQIFDFMASLQASQIGFNVEEIELHHAESSLAAADAHAAVTAFWHRLLQRMEAEPGRLRVREVEGVLSALRSPWFGQLGGNQQNQPGRLLNVAWDGSYCYWSPELLGASHPRFGPMALGNMTDSETALGREPLLAQIQQEIELGIAACRSECRHFDFCLGGAPVNKLSERGAFDVSDTLACRLGQRASIDAILSQLDRTLPAAA